MNITFANVPIADLVMAVSELTAVLLAIFAITRKPLKTLRLIVSNEDLSFLIYSPETFTDFHLEALRHLQLTKYADNVIAIRGMRLTEEYLRRVLLVNHPNVKIMPSPPAQ